MKKNPYPPIFDICWCHKCNEIVWGGRKYINGHNTRVNPPLRNPESAKKCSESQLGEKNHMFGKHKSEESKLKQSMSILGCKNHMFGYKWSDEQLKRQSEAHKWQRGELNPNYIDGRSYLPYCHKFNYSFKEDIRFRDSYICQLCGKTESENGERLSVHHVHYDKQNCEPDCIALCRCCNTKVNKNSYRSYYESLFMNKLNERHLLFWSKYRNTEGLINYQN